MAVITTISNLVRAYNLNGIKYSVVKDNPYEDKIPAAATKDVALYMSTLGTPVIADITLKGSTYTNNDGKQITTQDLTLVTVLVNVSQSKKIITTEIQGHDGTVKEYIGMDDYSIGINGILTGNNGQFPINDFLLLKELCKAPVALVVVSRYLQNLDIYNLVIKDFNFDQEAGGVSKQNFTLSCISDVPVELQIQ
jgi:hypothetical protein